MTSLFAFGKDEVSSSNLGSSSTRKPLVSADFRVFLFLLSAAQNPKRIDQRIDRALKCAYE